MGHKKDDYNPCPICGRSKIWCYDVCDNCFDTPEYEEWLEYPSHFSDMRGLFGHKRVKEAIKYILKYVKDNDNFPNYYVVSNVFGCTLEKGIELIEAAKRTIDSVVSGV